MNRGDLYRVRHPSGDTKRTRVFVVVSRQPLIDSRFSTVICAPVYTERKGIAAEVHIGTDAGLKHDSTILCDGLTSLPKHSLTDHIGTLHHQKLVELAQALRIALGVEAENDA
jgi:mRNA interferase MazF